jgi:two-component system chemotaxis response regulator CheB
LKSKVEAVVVGASAGAVEAFSEILPRLPSGYHLPLIAVIHLPADQKSILAELFQAKCKLTVKEVEDKELILPGTVYFAPANYHVLVEQDHRLSLTVEEQVLYSRPSIDVLFTSAADAYGDHLAGVILSGANSDGANGLKAICEGGGRAIVQSPETAFAPEMPRAALRACPNALELKLEEISEYLQRI